MVSFSNSAYIPMDTITYDIINKAAVKRINHQYSYDKYFALDLIKSHVLLCIDIGAIRMTYDGALKMAHFTSNDYIKFSIDQTPTHLIITTSRENGALRLIDKRTGEYFTARCEYRMRRHSIPDLLLALIGVYGQSQKAFINERLKNCLLNIYPIDEREFMKHKPIEEMVEDLFNPDYALFMWGYGIKPEQATRFKAWIDSLN